MRIKRGVTKRAKHKKILKAAKGYRAGRSKIYRQAQEAVIHAGADSYRGRRLKKRDFRSLWITQISASLPDSLSYSQFINKLKKEKIELDRKILSQIAREFPEVFAKIVETTTS